MARKKIGIVNKTILKAFIYREYGSVKKFADENDFKPNTVRKFLAGDDSLTNVNERIVRILLDNNVDPYGDLPVVGKEQKSLYLRQLAE